jgi:hypothetical protein
MWGEIACGQLLDCDKQYDLSAAKYSARDNIKTDGCAPRNSDINNVAAIIRAVEYVCVEYRDCL